VIVRPSTRSRAVRCDLGYILKRSMKFGQNLPHNQVPEWSESYIDYKALKKLIKSARDDTRDGEDADLASTVRLALLLAWNS
jgi:hypothetical protein